jgi:hypothetical protein
MPPKDYIRAPALVYPTREAIKAAIKEYCALGWRVFPVEPGGNMPMIVDWLFKATSDVDEALELFGRYADCNIGVVTGATSNVFGLCFSANEAEEGFGWLELMSAVSSWLALNPDESETHLFRRAPGEEYGSPQLPALGRWLGEGDYVVLPPSATRQGVYEYAETTNPDARPDPDGPERMSEELSRRGTRYVQPRATVMRLQILRAGAALRKAIEESGHSLRAELDQLIRALGAAVSEGLLPRERVEWMLPELAELAEGTLLNVAELIDEACSSQIGSVSGLLKDLTSAPADAYPEYRALADEAYLRGVVYADNRQAKRPWARPFRLADCADLPPRPYLLGSILTRGQLSVLVGQGEAGKTSAAMAIAMSIASGRSLLGVGPIERAKVWCWNGEEPEAEIRARFQALAVHHGLSDDDLDGWLDFGDRNSPLAFAKQGSAGFVIDDDLVREIVEYLVERNIGLVVLDPLISAHRIPENDNGAMDLLAKTFARIASEARCAFLVVHHTRKLNGHVATADDGRGAIALVNAARWVGAARSLSQREAADWGVPSEERIEYVKLETVKANLSRDRTALWLHLASVPLPNGNEVQAVEAWSPPADVPETSEADTLQIQQRVEAGRPDGQGPYRYSIQAGDAWGGVVVAEVLGLDRTVPAERARAKAILEALVDAAVLEVRVQRDRSKGRDIPCLFVGQGKSELGE